jgi:hypothetical protein
MSGEPQNTPLERTIGVGILVRARPGLPPLTAERPCSPDEGAKLGGNGWVTTST